MRTQMLILLLLELGRFHGPAGALTPRLARIFPLMRVPTAFA